MAQSTSLFKELSVEEGCKVVSGFLANRISLEQFEDWSISYLQNAYRAGDNEAQKLAQVVRSILNAFEDDKTEASLRRELANAFRPFELLGYDSIK